VQNVATTFPCRLPQKGLCAPCFSGGYFGTNHLICKSLWAVGGEIFRVISNFLPALRENRGSGGTSATSFTKGMIMFQVAW
jgi:hypothetical protein